MLLQYAGFCPALAMASLHTASLCDMLNVAKHVVGTIRVQTEAWRPFYSTYQKLRNCCDLPGLRLCGLEDDCPS